MSLKRKTMHRYGARKRISMLSSDYASNFRSPGLGRRVSFEEAPTVQTTWSASAYDRSIIVPLPVDKKGAEWKQIVAERRANVPECNRQLPMSEWGTWSSAKRVRLTWDTTGRSDEDEDEEDVGRLLCGQDTDSDDDDSDLFVAPAGGHLRFCLPALISHADAPGPSAVSASPASSSSSSSSSGGVPAWRKDSCSWQGESIRPGDLADCDQGTVLEDVAVAALASLAQHSAASSSSRLVMVA